MKSSLFAFAAACAIAAVPMSLAQTDPAPNPPAAEQPASPQADQPTPPPSTPDAATAPSTTPAPTTAAPTSATPAQADANARAACMTRKSEGEQCSCLSAPTNFGVAAPAASGSHNMCMVPES
jgi:hypothetical protein